MKIKFKEQKERDLFFSKIKEDYSTSWKEIYRTLNIPKSTFALYKSGTSCIPENLFNELINNLNEVSKKSILENIDRLPNNHGQILGGKIAYKNNKSYFVEGRKKGLISIKRKMEIENISFENLILTPELCEFIGAFIGDGMFNVYNNKSYQVSFAGDKRYDLEYYKNIIIPAAKQVQKEVIPRIYNCHKSENGVRVVFYSKKLFLFLRDFCGFVPGKKTYTIRIPDFLFNNEITRNKIIRGIFDTDGGVFLDKRKIYKTKYPRIIFQTVSKPLFEQLSSILSKNFKLYTGFNSKRQVYIIDIYGINQIKSWMKMIGFSNSRHLNRLLQ